MARFPEWVMLRLMLVAIVLVCAAHPPAAAQKTEELARLNQKVSQYYRAGKYAAAIEFARRALALAEAKFGLDHPDVGTLLNNLALMYASRGRFAEAVPLYERSVSIREKALEPDHLDVGDMLNTLADFYERQGRYAEAESLLKRSLSIYEKAQGAYHPNVGKVLNNLAELYESQGRYAEAEAFLTRTVTIAEKALFPDHADVATSLNNLAGVYVRQGRYSEAEPLIRRALSIREKKPAPDRLSVGASLNSLAYLYVRLGRFAEAEPLYKRAVMIMERASNLDHPSVGTILNNHAELYVSQGRYAKAEPLYKRAVAIAERALGLDHPHVGTSLNNLAGLYLRQGRDDEAEPLFKRAVTIIDKALGTDHPTVGTALYNLASLYAGQGRIAEAEPLFRRTVTIMEKALGPAHQNVGTILNSLALLNVKQGRYAEAELLYKQSLSIGEKALGSDHPDVGIPLNNLARLFEKLGRTADQAKVRARLALMPKPGTRHLPVYFATTRNRATTERGQADATAPLFTTTPTEATSFGRVVMQVPAEVIKRLGDDRATNLKLDRGREKLSSVDVFKRVRHRHLSSQTFATSLKAHLGRAALSKRQALIFVHGFNVDFDEATKRLSQVAFDLEFDGALIAFSWPSMGNQLRYLTDRQRADASVDQFVRFLDQLSADLPGVTLHVMAHSMGNRILTRALHKIAVRSTDATRPKLGEVILAHADATQGWCAKLGAVRPFVRGITNYANRDDAALRLSRGIRLGEARCGLNPRAYDGIETIDTTGMGGKRTSLFSVMFGAKNHHGVFANDPLLFGDISRLIASGQRPAHQRTPEFVERKDVDGDTYWAFDPNRMLGAGAEVAKAK